MAKKNLPASVGDTGDVGSIPGLGRIPWTEEPVVTVHEVIKSRTQLSTCLSNVASILSIIS